MLEIEIKASLNGIEQSRLLSLLKEQGFKAGHIKEETDIYFNGNNRDFRKTDEALRLRSSRAFEENRLGKADTFITYKGSKTDARSQTRPEFETAVEDPETMMRILDRLGYPVVMTVKKRRQYFCCGKITACLDEVEQLGSFIELEQVEEDLDERKEAVIDQLLALLDSFGIPRENLLQKSYLELLMIASATS